MGEPAPLAQASHPAPSARREKGAVPKIADNIRKLPKNQNSQKKEAGSSAGPFPIFSTKGHALFPPQAAFFSSTTSADLITRCGSTSSSARERGISGSTLVASTVISAAMAKPEMPRTISGKLGA